MRIDPSIVTADARAIFNSAVETNLLEMERLGMSIKRTSTQDAIIDHYFLTALNKRLRTSRQTWTTWNVDDVEHIVSFARYKMLTIALYHAISCD